MVVRVAKIKLLALTEAYLQPVNRRGDDFGKEAIHKWSQWLHNDDGG